MGDGGVGDIYTVTERCWRVRAMEGSQKRDRLPGTWPPAGPALVTHGRGDFFLSVREI